MKLVERRVRESSLGLRKPTSSPTRLLSNFMQSTTSPALSVVTPVAAHVNGAPTTSVADLANAAALGSKRRRAAA
jgi:hypothetical protein